MRKANVYLTSQFFNKVKQGFTVGFGGRYRVIMGPLVLAALATSLGR